MPRLQQFPQQSVLSRDVGTIKTELDEDDTGSKRSEWTCCVTEHESLFDESEGKQLRSKDGLFHKPQWLNAVAEKGTKGETQVGIFWPLWLMKEYNKEVVEEEIDTFEGEKGVYRDPEPGGGRCGGRRRSRAPTRCLSQPSWIRRGRMSRTQHVWTSQA